MKKKNFTVTMLILTLVLATTGCNLLPNLIGKAEITASVYSTSYTPSIQTFWMIIDLENIGTATAENVQFSLYLRDASDGVVLYDLREDIDQTIPSVVFSGTHEMYAVNGNILYDGIPDHFSLFIEWDDRNNNHDIFMLEDKI